MIRGSLSFRRIQLLNDLPYYRKEGQIVMKRSIQLIVFIIVILVATSGFCQIRPGAFSVSPFFGGFWFDGDEDLAHRPVYGLRLGYDFTKHWGAEAVFDYVNTEYKPTQDRTTDVFNYRIEGLYHFMPDSKLVPFVAVGVGAMSINYAGNFENKTRAAFDIGPGVKYFITDWLALRADARYVLTTGSIYNNLEYTLGLTFYFGGTKAATSPAKVESKPEPKAAEKVVILASEPKVEEKVAVLASEPEEKVIILAFEDVHFDFDKSTLTGEAQTILKRNIQILKDNPKSKVRIAGYTSASGTEEYNQRLSERRAKAVEEYLIKEGIVSPDRLSTIGYGKTRPAEYEAAPKDLYSKAAKANMRVLFEIIVK
jgi:OOP family OmpA-OmpF porin